MVFVPTLKTANIIYKKTASNLFYVV